MSILDKVKGYQRLARQETEPTPQPSTPERLPGGGTSEGTSFLQQFILKMMAEKGIPVAALRFVPGFGEELHKLLYGDPYQAHTYFADMLYQVQQLLDQDKEWDMVEVVRKREYAAAEERARNRRDTEQEERRTGNQFGISSALTSTSGPLDGTWTYREWEEHAPRLVTQAIPESVPFFKSADSGQQTTVQGTMVDGRPDREQTL